MLLSFSLVIVIGILAGEIFRKLKLPSLVGMVLAGIALGPNGFDLLTTDFLQLSTELRQLALVVILLRAGLSLNFSDLRIIGRTAVMMSFFPAILEMMAVVLLAPGLLNISVQEAVILGAVLAGISPAVIVPRMIKLTNEGYGKEKRIPQLIMAGASLDPVFAILIFTISIEFFHRGSLKAADLIFIPTSLFFGFLVGFIFGLVLLIVSKKVKIRGTQKALLMLGASFAVVGLESVLKKVFPFSASLSLIVIGALIYAKDKELAAVLKSKFEKIWLFAEAVLFVLVGTGVDFAFLPSIGFSAIILLLFALSFRMLGVILSTARAGFSGKERLFCVLAYFPKATVQAAIGGLPLALGVFAGDKILGMAIMAIILTAPIGALLIDLSYRKLLRKS